MHIIFDTVADMTTSSDYDEAIGKAIRQARELRGWSQAMLAEKLTDGDDTNWHQQTVLRLEGGQRSLKVRELLRLAEVLDVSPLGLLDSSVRSARGKELDRDDIAWMIRDLSASERELEGVLNSQSESVKQIEFAAQRIRHQREVLEIDFKQRVSEELRIYGPDGERV